MHKAARILSGLGSVVPLLILSAALVGFANQAPTMESLWGSCTEQMRAEVGTHCYERPVTDPGDALAEAARVAVLTQGMTCWEASEGRLGSHVVVRSEVGVELLPLDESTWAAAQRGEFETLKGCQS